MARNSIVKFLNPWRLKREREAERLAALRARDGDACARCRRPMRFDLPAGHDQGAVVEQIMTAVNKEALDNFGLCHARCHASGLDHTGEVTERVRRKNEAALFASARKRQRRAA